MAMSVYPYQMVAFKMYGAASHAPPEGQWDRVGVIIRGQDAQELRASLSQGGSVGDALPKFPALAYEIKGTTGSRISPDVVYIRMPDGSIYIFNDSVESQPNTSSFERREVLDAMRVLRGFGNFGYRRTLGMIDGQKPVQQKIVISEGINEILQAHLQFANRVTLTALDSLVAQG